MQIRLIHGDCIEVLRSLPASSVHAIVSDAPYGLTTITPDMVVEALWAWLSGEEYRPSGGGFMGHEWDRFVPGPEVWRECYRVLKPGGWLLSFFGSRTYHLGTLAIHLAGFEVRDLIAWLHGQGMTKAGEAGKKIDKLLGAKRPIAGPNPRAAQQTPNRGGTFNGFAGADKMLTSAATVHAEEWEGWSPTLKPGCEPIALARRPLEGTIAENLLKHGTGALNIDACRIGGPLALGRWPSNAALDEEAAAMLDEQAGERKSGSRAAGVRKGLGYHGAKGDGGPAIKGSTGGASRFFFCAKATPEERRPAEGVEKHPTVKRLELMQWLVRLVARPGMTIVDPFAGTGTTGLAAQAEGIDAILIERDEGYVKTAKMRLKLDSE